MFTRGFDGGEDFAGVPLQSGAFTGDQCAGERIRRRVSLPEKCADALEQRRLPHEKIADRRGRRGRWHQRGRFQFKQMPDARRRVAENGVGGIDRDEARAVAAASHIGMQRGAEEMEAVLQRSGIEPGAAGQFENGKMVGHRMGVRWVAAPGGKHFLERIGAQERLRLAALLLIACAAQFGPSHFTNPEK